MDYAELVQQAAQAPFEGWDLSILGDRFYRSLACAATLITQAELGDSVRPPSLGFVQ